MNLDEMDELVGFGKSASKTADWIVNTYLPSAPVSYRLSIEHAIATAILEAKAASPGPSELVEEMEKLEAEWRAEAAQWEFPAMRGILKECARDLRSLISRVTEGKKRE